MFWRKFCQWYIRVPVLRRMVVVLIYFWSIVLYVLPVTREKLLSLHASHLDLVQLGVALILGAPPWVLSWFVVRTVRKIRAEQFEAAVPKELLRFKDKPAELLEYQQQLVPLTEFPERQHVFTALQILERTLGLDQAAVKILLQYASKLDVSIPFRRTSNINPNPSSTAVKGLTWNFGLIKHSVSDRDQHENRFGMDKDFTYHIGHFRVWRNFGVVFFQNGQGLDPENYTGFALPFNPITLEQVGFGVVGLLHIHLGGCREFYVLNHISGPDRGSAEILT